MRMFVRGWRILAGMLLLTVLFTLLLAPSARAARFTGGDRVIIGPDEVVRDDLYISAREIIIEGRVEGDLFAMAQSLTVRGEITGDLTAMAQVVEINGRVGDDVRVAGQAIQIEGATIGDDILTAGFSIVVGEGVPVGGDVIAGGYQVLLAGDVAGNVYVGTNGLEIRGRVGGDVRASVGEGDGPSPLLFMPMSGVTVPPVAPGLTVAEGATVEGDLVYESLQSARILGTVRGDVTQRLPAREEQSPEEQQQIGSLPWALAQARRLLSLLVVGALLFLVLPGRVRRLGTHVHDRPLPALGWGIVALLGLIATVLIVLLVAVFATLILSLLTLSTLATWVLVLGFLVDLLLIVGYFAYTTFVVPVAVGYGALARLDRGGKGWIPPFVLGLVLYVGVTSLPYVGSIMRLIAILVGLGGLVLMWRHRATATPAEVVLPTPPPAEEAPPAAG